MRFALRRTAQAALVVVATFVLAFLLHRYGNRARGFIEHRLGLWVAIGAAVIVIGIVAALYLV